MPFGTERIRLQAALRDVVTSKRPNVTARVIGDGEGGEVVMEEVLLPLTKDGQTVNMIIRGLFRRDDNGVRSTAA